MRSVDTVLSDAEGQRRKDNGGRRKEERKRNATDGPCGSDRNAHTKILWGGGVVCRSEADEIRYDSIRFDLIRFNKIR